MIAWIKQLWETVQVKLFGKKPQVMDEDEREERRQARIASLNDPEDAFDEDEAYDEEDLARIAQKHQRSRVTRAGYYIFGSLMAVALIAWGIVGLLTAEKPDLYILVQNDEFTEKADIEQIKALVADVCPDINGDGKVVVDVTEVYMPAVHSDTNDSSFSLAKEDIVEVFLSDKVALCFGREEFLGYVDDYRDLLEINGEKTAPVSGMNLELSENSPLNSFFVGVRAKLDEKDTFSDDAKAVFDALTK